MILEKNKSGIYVPKKIKIKRSSALSMQGKVVATVARMKTPQHFKVYKEILRRIKMKLPYIDLVRKLNHLCTIRIFESSNVVCTVGRTMIANNLTDSSPDDAMIVNYVAIGDNNTTPVIGNTALGNETFRKTPPASRSNSNNIAYITAFYTTSEAIDTHEEVGLFCNGGAGSGSGIILVHALISTTKTGTDTLTIDHVVTLSDV